MSELIEDIVAARRRPAAALSYAAHGYAGGD